MPDAEKYFTDWQNRSFDPPQLPSWMIESEGTDHWMLRAIDVDRIRGMRALMYNLNDSECVALAQKTVTKKWVMELMETEGKEEALDLLVLLGECDFGRQVVMDHLIGRIPEGPHTQAFARILADLVPADLLNRTAHGLAELGYSEILENEQLLHHWVVAQGYLHLLSDDQYKRLGEYIGIYPARDLLARWLSTDAPFKNPPLPEAPPRFLNAKSLWHWHYERLTFESPTESASWKALQDRSEDLFGWWNALYGTKPRSETGMNLGKMRRLEIEPGEPQFQVRFQQKLVDPYQLLEQLKLEARTLDPIYGESARAAGVALRSDAEKLKLLCKLEPLEILDPSECLRYLYLYGADRSRVDSGIAMKFDRAAYDLLIFEAPAKFESVARLIARTFPGSCTVVPAPIESDRLGVSWKP